MGGRWGRATTLSSSTAGGARRFVRVVRFVRGVGFPEQFEAACSSGSGWKLLYFFSVLVLFLLCCYISFFSPFSSFLLARKRRFSPCPFT